MRTGHCLCGNVRYELAAELGPVVNCHCRFCRRAHGAAFASTCMQSRDDLRFGSGNGDIEEFHTPGVGFRAFCRRCGTRIYNRPESNPHILMLVVATLDDESGVAPLMHVNLESKAPWYEIRDGLPCLDGMPQVPQS